MLAAGAKLLPQRPDVHVNRARFAVVIRAPDLFHELVAREGHAGMLQEQAQQLKFLECQLHTLPICRDGVRVEVDRNAAALQKMRRCLHLAAAKDRLHAGDKLHDPEGLCEIVVRA